MYIINIHNIYVIYYVTYYVTNMLLNVDSSRIYRPHMYGHNMHIICT